MITPGDAHKKIDELARLEADWDSYKAPAISALAIAKAHEIVNLRDHLIQWVSPFAGGLQIDYAYHPYELEVEIGNDGSLDYNMTVRAFTCFANVTMGELTQAIDFATGTEDRKRGYLANKKRAADRGEDVSAWDSYGEDSAS